MVAWRGVQGEPLAVVVDAIPAIVTYIDADLRYRVVNATFRAWLGPIFGDVIGRTVAEVVGPAAYELLRGNLERALAGEAQTFEVRVPGADGRMRWVHCDYTPDRDASGRVRGLVGLAYDITAQKRAELHLSILAEAGRAFASAGDRAEVIARLAAIGVPRLADWAAVYVDTDGVLTPSEVVHAAAVAPERAWQLARSLLASPSDAARVHDLDGSSVAVAALVVGDERFGALAFGGGRGRWDAVELAVIEELARRGGAALEVLGRRGDGTGPGARAQPARPAIPARLPGTAGRLLVVDDNVDTAALIAQLLRELGYDVAIAHDAPSALELAMRRPPDIALLDVGLPGVDGYELGRRLRGQHAEVRLVAITGHTRGPDVERGRAAGFEHHIGKPFDVQLLATVLRQLAPRPSEEP